MVLLDAAAGERDGGRLTLAGELLPGRRWGQVAGAVPRLLSRTPDSTGPTPALPAARRPAAACGAFAALPMVGVAREDRWLFSPAR